MRNRIILIAIILCTISGFFAFSKIFGIAANPKVVAYKPYMFTEKDLAELKVTKFIKAIEYGDFKTTTTLMENSTKYVKADKVIKKFYNKFYRDRTKRYLILYPRDFVFNDSIVAMYLEVKNTIKPNENVETRLSLLNTNNNWLIDPTSDLFQALLVLMGSENDNRGEMR